MVFHAALLHGAGPNLSADLRRRALVTRWASTNVRFEPRPCSSARQVAKAARNGVQAGEPFGGPEYPRYRAVAPPGEGACAMTIYINPELTNDELRAELFAGRLVVLTGLPAVAELALFMRRELEALFAPHPPQAAHEHFTPTELAALLGEWKPRFIHDAKSARLLRNITTQAGFSAQDTHYDLPKPRTSFPIGGLSAGVAFAFPWHRDVWYAAPAQQIDWWLPVWPVRPDNAISFDLRSFAEPVPNDSQLFDYYRHNAGRRTTAAQVTREVQARPGALDHVPGEERWCCPR